MLYPYLFTIRMGISELVEEISKFSIDYSHGQPNLTKMENIHQARTACKFGFLKLDLDSGHQKT